MDNDKKIDRFATETAIKSAPQGTVDDKNTNAPIKVNSIVTYPIYGAKSTPSHTIVKCDAIDEDSEALLTGTDGGPKVRKFSLFLREEEESPYPLGIRGKIKKYLWQCCWKEYWYNLILTLLFFTALVVLAVRFTAKTHPEKLSQQLDQLSPMLTTLNSSVSPEKRDTADINAVSVQAAARPITADDSDAMIMFPDESLKHMAVRFSQKLYQVSHLYLAPRYGGLSLIYGVLFSGYYVAV